MLNRIILFIELVVLCGPAVALLFLGIIYFPVFLIGFASDSGDWRIGALMILCGTWGSLSLANLAWHTFGKANNDWPGRPIQWLGIATGLAACIIGLTALTGSKIMFSFLGVPLLPWLIFCIYQKMSLS